MQQETYLTRLFDDAILKTDDVSVLAKELMSIRKKKEYLEKHPYKLYQGGDGRWFTRFPCSGGGSKQKAFRTEEAAIEAIVNFYSNKEESNTVKDVFRLEIDDRFETGSISESTVTRYKYDFIRFYSGIENQKITNISTYELEEFLKKQKAFYELDAKGYAKLLAITRLIFKKAKRLGLVDFRVDDVISDIEWGRNAFRKERRDEEEVFSDEEVKKLVGYFKANPTGKHLGLLLCFVTGLRIGELSTLKWEDILEDSIIVRRTETCWSDEDGRYHCEVKNLPKTDAGKRVVPIPEQGMWIIEELRKLNPNGPFIFMVNGARSRTVYFRKAMEKACDAVDILRRSPHKIRKTYASILLDNNVSEKIVTENMGHTTIDTTNASYARRRKSRKQMRETVSSIPEFNFIE